MSFNPTPEQLAIRDFVASGRGSLLVNALAGSAKSTTLEFCAQDIRTPAAALAFNTEIRASLRERLPENFEVVTFNSAGLSAWGRYLGKVKLNTDGRKTYRLCMHLGRGEFTRQVMALVNAAKNLGLVPDGNLRAKPSKVFYKDDAEGWHAVQALANVEELQDGAIDAAREALVKSTSLAFEGDIDFNDQIYMPCCFGGMWKQFPLIFVDEAQDLSALNHYMLRRMALKRVIAVGDRNQAIYAFRGASHKSLDDLGQIFKAEELRLTTCFRCSVAVVNEARQYTPDMNPASWAPPGSVTRLREWTLADIAPDSAVLCRNNSPLFALGFAFLAAGRPVNFNGKDLGFQIEKEMRSLSGGNNIFKTALIQLLDEKIDRTAEDLRERLWDIREIIEAIPGEDTDAVSRNLSALLSAPSGDVTLSSIHGSKGLEWGKVYFLDRWRIPSRYATTEEQIQQEMNLAYVGVTRAKLDLVYINLDGLDRNAGTSMSKADALRMVDNMRGYDQGDF